MDRDLGAVGARHQRLHRIGIFGAEIEDLADLDAPGVHPLSAGTSRSKRAASWTSSVAA